MRPKWKETEEDLERLRRTIGKAMWWIRHGDEKHNPSDTDGKIVDLIATMESDLETATATMRRACSFYVR